MNATPDTPADHDALQRLVAELQTQLQALSTRVAALEQQAAGPVAAAAAAAPAAPASSAEPTEDDLLVIAAAVAAFLGVRVRIRQVRLLQSTAWAQVGRATVHASHRVH